jgi:hypothetical protein
MLRDHGIGEVEVSGFVDRLTDDSSHSSGDLRYQVGWFAADALVRPQGGQCPRCRRLIEGATDAD